MLAGSRQEFRAAQHAHQTAITNENVASSHKINLMRETHPTSPRSPPLPHVRSRMNANPAWSRAPGPSWLPRRPARQPGAPRPRAAPDGRRSRHHSLPTPEKHPCSAFFLRGMGVHRKPLLAAGNHARFRSSSMILAGSGKGFPAYPRDSGAPVEDLTLAPAEGRARRCDVKPVPRYKGRHRHAGEHRGSRVGTASLGSQTRGGLSYYET